MGGGSALPYDAEVEYLQSSGGQWIDSGIVPNINTGIECTIEWVTISNHNSDDKYVFGMRQSTGNTRFWVGVANKMLRGAVGGFESSNVSISANDKKVLTFNLNGNSRATWGGEYYDFTATSFSASYNAYIFAVNNRGSASYNVSAKLYSFKIYNGLTLVRDYIPVRVGQVGYLYDKVSRTLFANAGTGSFILGPDKT